MLYCRKRSGPAASIAAAAAGRGAGGSGVRTDKSGDTGGLVRGQELSSLPVANREVVGDAPRLCGCGLPFQPSSMILAVIAAAPERSIVSACRNAASRSRRQP